MISFGQQNTTESDFRNGYIKGFKKGYCIDDSFCNPPFSIEVPLWGKMGFNTYSDGYNKGVIAGKAKKESTSIIRGGNSSISDKESSSSKGAYENAGAANTSSGGAYENPTTVIQPNVDAQLGQAATAAGENYKWWSEQKEKEVIKWSVRRDENILWKVPLEETGQSGIIRVGDLLFLSIMRPVYDTITKRGTDILALCYNAITGEKVWQKEITGVTESLYMYGFSNSSSPTPVSDGKKVWFINASGKIVCFDLDGNIIWERSWTPISKLGDIVFPFNKQYEPILHKNILINVEPEPTEDANEGYNPNWHYLVGLDKDTGEVLWKSNAAVSHYSTPIMGKTKDGNYGVMVARIGSAHQVPEKPYGYSLVNIENGFTIWDSELPAKDFFYNSTWNEDYTVWIYEGKLYVLDSNTGERIKEISLSENVTLSEYDEDKKKYIKQVKVDLNDQNIQVIPNFYSNFMKGEFYYFLTIQTHPDNFQGRLANGQSVKGPFYSVARVNLNSNLVEYLEVPVDIDNNSNPIWRKLIPSGTKNSRGIDVAEDRRGKLNGWFRCFNANPFAVNFTLYFTLENGMTYTFDISASDWDENALISLNDMGVSGTSRTLSHPLVIGNKIYHRTAQALFCIKED
ncbi:PQQ-binding-like beta-propeller repeat protein [Flavobacteriaceae bacterium]|nr:PQQ-binding-like beta-propeller repeat protein [Flavobacteriaceae bacterium]